MNKRRRWKAKARRAQHVNWRRLLASMDHLTFVIDDTARAVRETLINSRITLTANVTLIH
jgi:hypothetical protein